MDNGGQNRAEPKPNSMSFNSGGVFILKRSEYVESITNNSKQIKTTACV
ncbi:MAG: hypothetical protein ACJAS8_001516 [Cycloclasticus pugetii]|jgi:hypothetical protein